MLETHGASWESKDVQSLYRLIISLRTKVLNLNLALRVTVEC